MTHDQALSLMLTIDNLISAKLRQHAGWHSDDPECILQLADDVEFEREELTDLFKRMETADE